MMRLLNVKTLLLEDAFFNSTPWPSYTILSHTWGKDEVSFTDLTSGKANGLAGYQKLSNCCGRSALEGFEYTWIDTCCIDKSSSAELSEAINSMFNWYSKAQVCYAYLSDVDGLEGDHPTLPSSSFRKSRWFRRGWTLQELLAPLEVVFLNKNWVEIGTKTSLASVIASITQIEAGALGRALCGSEAVPHVCTGYSVAQKMSWTASRETTRDEDRAYSLLGLFGVKMPLLYGEGGEAAFARLQQEIMKQSSNDSIFAWSMHGWQSWVRVFAPEETNRGGCMAWRPELFYAGFTIHTAAAADILNDHQDEKWPPETLAHTSIVYEESKHFISLTAPILTSVSLSKMSNTSIFGLYTEPSSGPTRDKVLSYAKFTDEYLKSVLNETRVIAILSCCFHFGRVGIVLEKCEDDTYTRVHKPTIVGVQVTELPECEMIKIRSREGVGDPCIVRAMISRYNIMGLDVRLMEGNGYFLAGRDFKCSENINPLGELTTTVKGERFSFFLPPLEGRVALLYRHADGYSGSNPSLVLVFHWTLQTELRFAGFTISDSELADWGKNLSWQYEWREPEATRLSLTEARHIDVKFRKAPSREGHCWYAFLYFM